MPYEVEYRTEHFSANTGAIKLKEFGADREAARHHARRTSRDCDVVYVVAMDRHDGPVGHEVYASGRLDAVEGQNTSDPT